MFCSETISEQKQKFSKILVFPYSILLSKIWLIGFPSRISDSANNNDI